MASDSFDLAKDYVHLGLGARVELLPDFTFTPERLAAYDADHAADGDDGRLVLIDHQEASWTGWERHPAGEELVVLLSGRADLIQDRDGALRRIPLEAGRAAVNPRGVWHTADVHEPGSMLFITPGRGTEVRPR